MRKFLILLFISGIAAFAALGQAIATLEEKEMLMGNLNRLSISVPVPNDSTPVEFPILREAEAKNATYVALLNDTVELLVKHKRAFETDGNSNYVRYDLSIQAFDSGRYELPSLDFIVGGEKISSNPVSFSVLPVKVKADDKIDDFTDIAQPFELNPNPEALEEGASALIWWIAAAAILVLLAILIMLFRKNGRIFPLAKPVTPYKEAVDKLEKLRKQNLPAKGKVKEYYTRLTDILRMYLKKQFDLRTLDKTSSEILYQVENNNELASYADVLKSIFETSDFVKFAKVNPLEEENLRCLLDAIRFVEVTHPVENEDEKKKGGAK